MRPLEACREVVAALKLTCSPERFLAESEAILASRWAAAETMAGAARLVRHLAVTCNLPLGIATSTTRAKLHLKVRIPPTS